MAGSAVVHGGRGNSERILFVEESNCGRFSQGVPAHMYLIEETKEDNSGSVWLARRTGCLTTRRLVIYNATKSEARGVEFSSFRVSKMRLLW